MFGATVIPTQILSGYNQGRIDHKLDSLSPWPVPPDIGDA